MPDVLRRVGGDRNIVTLALLWVVLAVLVGHQVLVDPAAAQLALLAWCGGLVSTLLAQAVYNRRRRRSVDDASGMSDPGGTVLR